MKLYKLKAFELINLIKRKEISVKEVVESFFDRVNKVESKVDAFLHLYQERATEQAIKADERIKKGEKIRALEGIPMVLKDNILSKGDKTTAASKMLENYVAPYDATVVEKLKEAGSIIIGKATLDEFAMGSSGEYSAFKLAKNPWDLTRVPGGSSSGSTACVAANMSPLALGSETGGSVRQPAAFCGVVGLKPSYGRISRYGLITFASSLDQIAPLAQDVRDIALTMNVIAGHDEKETTSAKVSVPNYLDSLDKDIKGIKVGILKKELLSGADKEILDEYERTYKILEGLGAIIEEIEIKDINYSIEVYFTINPSEVSSNLARLDGLKYGLAPKDPKTLSEIYNYSRANGFGQEVKRRIMIGNFVLSADHYESYYIKACKVRNIIKQSFNDVFRKVDVVLMPTTPTKAFKFGENTNDPVKMYLSDMFTIPANLTGNAAISVPTTIKNGLPIGMQFIANNFEEALLLKVAHAFERERGSLEEPNL